MRNSQLKDFVFKNVYQNASNGYVLTPSALASEMVSTLPDSVFESDSTTFLDPICKSGTFLFELVEKLYDKGHSISNIQKRIYTIDGNSHSLNVAQSFIRKILNKESGSFKINYKEEFIENFFNLSMNVVSKGKFKTLDDFLNIIILNKNDKELMTIFKDKVSEFIAQYEKVSKLESKLFGEVFTPRQLIDEMLDTLPAEVWTNKDLKWLDPAVGIGNFPKAILDRLMVGLECVIPNEDERVKHILEEMLYMCDISVKNLFILYQLFDKNNEFKLNVYRGSFLTEDFDKHMKEVWKLDGVDVVVGNPPYQSPDVDKGQSHIYHIFVKKSIYYTTNLVLFVTPPTFLKDKIESVFGSKFLYINTDVKKYFEKVGTSFIFYILKKTDDEVQTKIFDGVNEFSVKIDYNKLIPVGFLNGLSFSIIDKIYSQDTDRRFSFKRNETPFPKNAAFIRRMNRNQYFNCLKTDNSFDLKVNQDYTSVIDVDNLISLLNSKLFSFFYLCYSTSPFITLGFINKIPFAEFEFKNMTQEEIYKAYNLTQEEIDLIEKTIKD